MENLKIHFQNTAMQKLRKTRINPLLAMGMLAAFFVPQTVTAQNNEYDFGDYTLRSLTLSGIELPFFPHKTYYSCYCRYHRRFNDGYSHIQQS